MKNETMSATEKKRIEALDRKIEKAKKKVSETCDEYEEAVRELRILNEERYPEQKTKRIKEELYKAFLESGRPLDEVIESIKNPYLEEDIW